MPRGPWCRDESVSVRLKEGAAPFSSPHLGGWVRVWELVLGCCAVRKERKREKLKKVNKKLFNGNPVRVR
jgi:hypothetical protein